MVQFEQALRRYFRSYGWAESICPVCRRSFFQKRNFPTCRSLECENRYIVFDYPRPKKPSLPAEIWAETRLFFQARGFPQVCLDNVVNASGDTLFVIAGVQYFDGVIHQGEPILSGARFIAQPSIRLKYLDRVGDQAGISSAFVNLCSGQLAANLEDYIEHLDLWIACLSSLGLFAGDLSLIVEPENWEEGPYKGRCLAFNYGGVELGEGIFIFEIEKKPGLTLVDCGFGFERIVWAANRNKSYYHWIGPWLAILGGHYLLIDLVRSVTLIASSGVKASNRSHGYRLRLLAKRIAEYWQGGDLVPLVKHSYDYWTWFIDPPMSVDHCISMIQEEVGRFVNLDICRRLARQSRHGIRSQPDAFCETLLREGVSPDQLFAIMQPECDAWWRKGR